MISIGGLKTLRFFVNHFQYQPITLLPIRRATIVERVYPPEIPEDMPVEKYDLDRNCYVYRVVSKDDDKDWGNIDVVLTRFVEGLGYKGEVVSVPRLDFYSNLSPSGIALYATERNLKKFEDDRKLLAGKPRITPSSLNVKKIVEKLILKIPIVDLAQNMKPEGIVTVSKDHIRLALRKENVFTTNDNIIMDQVDYNLKEEFLVKIQISESCFADLKFVPVKMTDQELWEEFNSLKKQRPL